MPQYKLQYFSAKALGEAPRMLFVYGGQEFEDIRVPACDWPALKPKTLYGQMPLLIIDGKEYAQSKAISRYLGNKFGLTGDTLEENLEIDQIVDFIYDIKAKSSQVHYETDQEQKVKRHENYSSNVYPDMLAKLTDIIEQNDGHVALGKLTWGDFILAGMFDYLKMAMQDPDLEKKYPSMQKVVDNVVSIPEVRAYIDAAPETEFKF